tara:strand:+ start:669 stop:1184 length:516 start_codon:yes stop_codon:yes gene_type:complete
MFSVISLKIKNFNRLWWTITFLFPLITSCASNQNKVVEIITPPKLPKEFSSIPETTETPKLLALVSGDQRFKDITVGRDDPFLPPQQDSNKLSVPVSFKYHGQISSIDNVNAFVSYNNQTGILIQGDIGGESTELLPPGWIVEKIDVNTNVLKLTDTKNSLEIDLFPQKSD